MSDEKYKSIRRFIVRHIQDQNLPEDNGVSATTLLQVCLQHFCTGVQDPDVIKSEKGVIVDAIKKIIGDGVLNRVRSGNDVVFRLDPFYNVKDKMNARASEPAEDPQGTQEGLEALEKEISPDAEDWQMDQDQQEGQLAEDIEEQEERQQEEQQVDRTEATRHAEGYAEMTRGAAPLPPEPSEEHLETPSRKRRKVLEIAASDASSSFDPISPGRYPNSTPRRTMKRLGTPLPGSRRRSAPTGIFKSPFRWRSPKHIEQTGVLQQKSLKEEMTDTSPAWLRAGVENLRSKYPDSAIISENGYIKCLDCEGRLFKPAGNNSLHNVDTHLRSKAHQDRTKHRLEKLGLSGSFLPTTVTTMDFSIPQGPLTVFAHPGQQNLASLRTQYLQALENDAQMKAIRTTIMEGRVVTMEKKNKEHLDRMNASLEAFQRRNAEQQEHMSDMLAISEQRHKNLSLEVTDRVNATEKRSKEQLQKMYARIDASEEKSTLRLDDMIGRLARSDHRNIDQIENMVERIDQSEKRSEERESQLAEKLKLLEQINEGQNENIHDLESQCQLLTEALQRQQNSQESFCKAMTDQMDAHLQQTEKLMAKLEKQNVELLKNIEQQAAERIKKYEMQTATKIRSLEKRNEEQQECIQRFEAVLPIVLQDFQELQEFVQDIESRTATRQAVTSAKTHVSIAT